MLASAHEVLSRFRTGFLGKASPVHFFWGSFDLAVTRFSGRPAPRHPGGVPHLPDAVAREAYSHEVSSAGFWPGGGGREDAAFYSYAYPAPEGFAEAKVKPAAAYFSQELGEFLLPYDGDAQRARSRQALMEFLVSTYEAAADLAQVGSRGARMRDGAGGDVPGGVSVRGLCLSASKHGNICMSNITTVMTSVPKPAPTLLEAFREAPTSIISDNLERLPGAVGLKPFHRGGKLVGVAFTVKTRPGDNLAIHKALELVGPGDVIVVDGGGDESRALVGEIMKTIAEYRGAAGYVIDGAIRDAAELAADDFPMFARTAIHRGPL